jgi:hypothetical protein
MDQTMHQPSNNYIPSLASCLINQWIEQAVVERRRGYVSQSASMKKAQPE